MLPIYELAQAIKSNNVEDAKAALDNNADPNGKDLSKLSMLQLAEKHHANDVVPLLLKYGADLGERIGKQEDTLLHRAVRHYNFGFACALLEAGISPNLANARGEVPLHLAARTGQAYLAQILIKYNANPMARDAKGRSPSDVATAANQFEMIRLFKPFEYHAICFGDAQDPANNQLPSIANAGDIPNSELQIASECIPNSAAESRFSKNLHSEQLSSAKNLSYDR